MFSFNHSGWVSCFTHFVLIGASFSSTDIKEGIHKEKFEFVFPEERLKLFNVSERLSRNRSSLIFCSIYIEWLYEYLF